MFLRLLLPVITIFISVPVSALAAVTINEVAWMGGPDSANYEWIELYNSGSEAVNVDGWTLIDGMNLNISLTGTIAASSYAVLERSSDETVKGTAFLIYTGALVNTGATLVLKTASGGIADQVAGGENWQNIGGDNTTKETAQYTTKGWVTDTPTPGTANGGGRVVVPDPVIKAETTTVKTNSVSKTVTAASAEKARSVSLGTGKKTVLSLTADMQDVAYVNQTIPFSVESSGIGDTIINSLVYTWNFGDTYLATGKEVKHTYAYPGTYVITLNAHYAESDETIRREITILPVTFSITKNELGDIQIQNDSPYDVDMSGYLLRGDKEIIFPAKTIILPRSTITVAKNRLQSTNENLVALYDDKRKMLTSTYEKMTGFETLPPAEVLVKGDLEEARAGNFSEKLPALASAPVTVNEAFNFATDPKKTEIL